MKYPKIIICTTFRDFKGTENDEIQRLFIKSLESQTYGNFELVVTLFGEKKVKDELKKYKLKKIFYLEKPKECRYSLSKVVLNAIEYSRKKCIGNYIILWTTCDVIYNATFLEAVIKKYRENMIGTSHPHIIYGSKEDYNEKVLYKKNHLSSGFDFIYFDRKFINSEKILKVLKKYIYKDWGIFEHFLISLAELKEKPYLLNLYEDIVICKIENNRNVTKEPNTFLLDSHKLNTKTFKKFLTKYHLSLAYLDLVYCHFRFKLTKNSFNHYTSFILDILLFCFREFRRFIWNLIPKKIQKIIHTIE